MFSGPILNVSVAPAGDASWLSGAKVIAYAGIANPSRFFKLLETLRADVCASVAFRDHQTISGNDARDLIARAKAEHATLVTTEKDFVRLPATAGATADQNAQHQLRSRSRTLPIKIVMPDEEAAELLRLLEKAIASAAQD